MTGTPKSSDPKTEPFDEELKPVNAPAEVGEPESLAERAKRNAFERLLQPLLPAECNSPPTANNESQSSIPGLLLISYLSPIIDKALRLDTFMEPEDVDPVVGPDRCDEAYGEFQKHWQEERERNPASPSIFKTLLRQHKFTLISMNLAVAIETCTPFTTPVLLGYLNEFLADSENPLWHGALLAGILFVSTLLNALAASHSFRCMQHVDTRASAALSQLVVSKTMCLSLQGEKEAGGRGALYQAFAADIAKVSLNTAQLARFWDIFAQLIAVLIYLGILVGWPVVGVIVSSCVFTPITSYIMTSFQAELRQKTLAGDIRAAKIVEIFNSMKAIKFFAWEEPFSNVVSKLRDPELRLMRAILGSIALFFFTFSLATPVTQLSLFILMAVRDSDSITVTIFFQALSLTYILSQVLVKIPGLLSESLQTSVALERLQRVLSADERQEQHIDYASDPISESSASAAVGTVKISNGMFSWFPLDAHLKEQNEALKFKDPAQQNNKSPTKGKDAPPSEAEDISRPAELNNVEFEAAAGELVVLVGKVGTGKSSLIAAILGEMVCNGGSILRKGSVAYIPQTAWILNATVRNNIIMDRPFDQDKYDQVLEATELHGDLAALPNGDLTEVGEKGINLSGGQRQRLSIARALYMEADIYLFDDPLSALDAHIGGHVFNNAIMGMLKDKTRILVTHQMTYLSQAVRIYSFEDMIMREESLAAATELVAKSVDDADGTPEKPGSPQKMAGSPLADLLRAWNSSSAVSASPMSPSQGGTVKPPSPAPGRTPNVVAASPSGRTTKSATVSQQTLTVREERHTGAVKSSTLFTYLRNFGGPLFFCGMFFFYVMFVCLQVFGHLWMAFWTERRYSSIADRPPAFFLGIYAASVFCAAVVALGRELLWREGAVNAPRVLYDQMLQKVLAAPMSFFDTTPTGRIINRFTKDSARLDLELPFLTNQTISSAFMVVGTMISICAVVPYFAIPAVILLLFVAFVQPTVAIVVLRRLSSATAGPVAALYSETLGGAASIRALGLTGFFHDRFSHVLNDSACCKLADKMLFEYVRVRVNILLACVQCTLLLIIMATRSSLTPATASFAVTQSLSMTLMVTQLLMRRANMALSLNSIERLTDYIAVEGEEELQAAAKAKESPSGIAPPPVIPDASWPRSGTIDIKDLTVRYRENLPLVIKGINVQFRAGEKIGVCGRTGSGKSSLILALFRMVPIEAPSRIFIDGVDTSTMPLRTLRSNLAAIPQDPVLFSGTVRYNLDPFALGNDKDGEDESTASLASDIEAEEEKLVKALELCHLVPALQKLHKKKAQAVNEKRKADSSKEAEPLLEAKSNDEELVEEEAAVSVRSLLDMKLSESDLSLGQKQLLCLARAIARDCKVLVLDEATSSVDVATDVLVQNTIRTVFSSCTVITIAHRLNTIMDSDKVLVLDTGTVAEFDTPAALLEDEESIFASMVSAQEEETSATMSPAANA